LNLTEANKPLIDMDTWGVFGSRPHRVARPAGVQSSLFGSLDGLLSQVGMQNWPASLHPRKRPRGVVPSGAGPSGWFTSLWCSASSPAAFVSARHVVTPETSPRVACSALHHLTVHILVHPVPPLAPPLLSTYSRTHPRPWRSRLPAPPPRG
jgi:hypothetical protein